MKIVELVRLNELVKGFVVQGISKEKVIEFLDWHESVAKLIETAVGELKSAQVGLEFDENGNALDKELFEKVKQSVQEIGDVDHDIKPLFTMEELLQLVPQGVSAGNLQFLCRVLVKR